MNFHQIFIEIATSCTFFNGTLEVYTSMVSDFLEVYGPIGLKICPKNVKQISDIIQNGSLVVILGINNNGSHNSDNVISISFKLGTERLYRRGNMHARSFSV